VVEGALLAMTMTMTMVRVGGTRRAGRKGPGKGREHKMGRGKGTQLRTGRGQGRGRGREMVMGKVLLNKPPGQMISLVPLLCSFRGNVRGRHGHEGLTGAGIFRAGSIAHPVNFLR